jgi:hypothetical protein
MSHCDRPGSECTTAPKRTGWGQRARRGGLLAVAALLGCGSSSGSQILVALSNVPARATTLSVSATLGGKTASAMSFPLPLDRFGVTLPDGESGALTLNLQALDTDQCTQGIATQMVTLPSQQLDPPLAAPLSPESPRKCGALSACAGGTVCAVSSTLRNTIAVKGLWAFAPNNIWGVAWNKTLLHYDGTAWTTSTDSDAYLDLNGIWGSSPSDIWAVGSNGTALHYDGNKWTSFPIPTVNALNAVYGTDPKNVWAVGDAATTTSAGDFWYWNGTSWSKVSNAGTGSLLGVWAGGASDVFAVGASGLIVHYNGVLASVQVSPTTNDLVGMWGSASNQVFAVGAQGTIVRYNGSSWSLVGSNTVSKLYAIFGSTSALYAVGNSGTVLRSNATLDNFQTYAAGTSAGLFAGQLGSDGLAWIGGYSGFIGFFDTRP